MAGQDLDTFTISQQYNPLVGISGHGARKSEAHSQRDGARRAALPNRTETLRCHFADDQDILLWERFSLPRITTFGDHALPHALDHDFLAAHTGIIQSCYTIKPRGARRA